MADLTGVVHGVERLLFAVAATTLTVATPITDTLGQEEGPLSQLYPNPCLRGRVVLTGALSSTPHCQLHAQAYPFAVNAGGIAERTFTA